MSHIKPSPLKEAHHRSNLLSRREAAAYLNIKEQTLAVWACYKRHRLPFIRVGRLVKYRQEDLDQFVLENCVGAAT